MKKRLLILVCVLGVTLISAGVACATVKLDFSNLLDTNIEFLGNGNFKFNPDTEGDCFKITGGTGLTGTTVNLTGVIGGLFTISNIVTVGPLQTGDVAGDGTITITDADNKKLVLGVHWLSIYTSGASGSLNSGALANLTFVSYNNLLTPNPDLAAFENGGKVTATFQFSDLTDLTYLTTHDATTSYSGSMTAIPLPPSALLLGTGLLGLVGLGYRRKRKS